MAGVASLHPAPGVAWGMGYGARGVVRYGTVRCTDAASPSLLCVLVMSFPRAVIATVRFVSYDLACPALNVSQLV